MPRYTLAVDISRCDGCGSCFMACKDEHIGNDHLPITYAQPRHGHQWLRIDEIEQGEGSKPKVDYIPVMCQHCKEPACAKGSGDFESAVMTRNDGIVTVDCEKAKGFEEMVKLCPYGAVFYNEEKQVPQKCTMCAHMIDSGEMTVRCAESCPTKALFFGDIDDPDSEISKYIRQKGDFTAFSPRFGTKPSVLYRALPAPFITGEVVLTDKSDECCAGAAITCICEACEDDTDSKCSCGEKTETITDFMGDFQFKGLVRGGVYTITASYPGYEPYTTQLTLHSAKDLGTITLKKI